MQPIRDVCLRSGFYLRLPSLRVVCFKHLIHMMACQKQPQTLCGACLSARYCSRECQANDWPKHKLVCVDISSSQVHHKSLHLRGSTATSGFCPVGSDVTTTRVPRYDANRCCDSRDSVIAVINAKLESTISDGQERALVSGALGTALIQGNPGNGGGDDDDHDHDANQFVAPNPIEIPETMQEIIVQMEPASIRTLWQTGSSVLIGPLSDIRTYTAWVAKKPNIQLWVPAVSWMMRTRDPAKRTIAEYILTQLYRGDSRTANEMLFYGLYDLWRAKTGETELPSMLPALRVHPPVDDTFRKIVDGFAFHDTSFRAEEFYPRRVNGVELSPALPAVITDLNLNENLLEWLPSTLPPNLSGLRVAGNRLEVLPRSLPDTLQMLDIPRNRIKALPARLPEALTYLNAANCQLASLPVRLPPRLRTLWVQNNNLTELPSELPATLNSVAISKNRIAALPTRLPQSLRYLNLDHNELERLSDEQVPLGAHSIDLSHNKLVELPDVIGPRLTQLNDLILSFNPTLRRFPQPLNLPTLDRLYLNGMALKSVPDLSALTQLGELSLNQNNLDDIPLHLNSLPRLHTIWLAENNITEPDMTRLPASLSFCDLSDNPITKPPTNIPADTEVRMWNTSVPDYLRVYRPSSGSISWARQ